jgi:hypothetical protein
MMRTADPNHIERFGVVLMVGLDSLRGVTEDARSFLNSPALYVNMEIRAAVVFALLFCSRLVQQAILPHLRCVAFKATALPF